MNNVATAGWCAAGASVAVTLVVQPPWYVGYVQALVIGLLTAAIAKLFMGWRRRRGTSSPPVAEMMQRLDDHRYTSTACLHSLHSRCRELCKYCAEPCHCRCHEVLG